MTAVRRRREEDPDALAERVLAGDRRAVARAISLAEDEHPGAQRLLQLLYPHAGTGAHARGSRVRRASASRA